jgi:hypothetical protein
MEEIRRYAGMPSAGRFDERVAAELASARRRCVAWLRPGWGRGVSGLEADMAGDDRGLAGELDVAYSSAEEFGRLVLESDGGGAVPGRGCQ